MRYVGGKSKIAKEISQIINNSRRDGSNYWEPFFGGGSMLPHISQEFSSLNLSDISDDLILMWQALQDGWTPDQFVSEERYRELRDAPPSALRGLVGFGGSFGGKWFGGYARGGFNSDGSPRNHQWESARAAMRIAAYSRNGRTEFQRRHYRTISPVPGDVVYCDPPYASTQGYASDSSFNSVEFWDFAEGLARAGVVVFVSEYSAPDDWSGVWSKQKNLSLTTTDQGRPKRVEKLFTYGGLS